MKLIDLNTLGSKLRVVDKEGVLIQSVMVFGMKEVLDRIMGFYDKNRHGDLDNYLEMSKSMLTGKIEDPYSIYWHTWRGKSFDINEVVRDCVRAGCKNLIVERLHDVSEGNEATMVF